MDRDAPGAGGFGRRAKRRPRFSARAATVSDVWANQELFLLYPDGWRAARRL